MGYVHGSIIIHVTTTNHPETKEIIACVRRVPE